MPLSSPVRRERAHTRTIECSGYEREDGLWDIDGHITDVKTKLLTQTGRAVQPGEPVHEMWLRLTIDNSFTIRFVEVAMDAYRYPICTDVISNYQRLVGLTIGRGFGKAVKNVVGDVRGCTHLNELIGRMAGVALQATFMARGEREGFNSESLGRSLINACRTYASDSPVVLQRFPRLYTGRGQ